MVTQREHALERDDWQALQGHVRMRNSRVARIGPEGVAQYLGRMGFDVIGGSPGGSLFEALIFDSFFVAHNFSAGIQVRWDRSLPSTARRYLFEFVLHGNVTFEGAGPQFASPTGDLLVAFPSQEPLVVTSSGSETLVFTFDAQDVTADALEPGDFSAERVSSTMVRAALTYLTAITRPEVTATAEDSTALRSTIREIARSLLSALTARSVEPPLVVRAREYIVHNSSDPGLTAQTIAERMGVSRRTLDRHFAQHDMRVAVELRRARLATALQHLARRPAFSASRIAMTSGFGSAASLDRAAVAELGISTEALRRSFRDRATEHSG